MMKRKRLIGYFARGAKALCAIALGAAFLGTTAPAYAQDAAKKPNILFIMGDDIG